jgi:hypothetical protein
LLQKIQELEEKLLETQLQLEKVIDEKLTHMLSIQKSPTDKTSLGYVAPPSDTPFTSRTVFVKPAVPDPPPTIEDKGKDKLNGDVPGTQKPPSTRRPHICHHYGLSRLVRPQCSLLKAQKAKHQGIRLFSIKLLGLMHHDTWHLSIRDLSSDLYLPITVANPRSNPSTLKGRRRWKMINTTESHLFGCKA